MADCYRTSFDVCLPAAIVTLRVAHPTHLRLPTVVNGGAGCRSAAASIGFYVAYPALVANLSGIISPPTIPLGVPLLLWMLC